MPFAKATPQRRFVQYCGVRFRLCGQLAIQICIRPKRYDLCLQHVLVSLDVGQERQIARPGDYLGRRRNKSPKAPRSETRLALGIRRAFHQLGEACEKLSIGAGVERSEYVGAGRRRRNRYTPVRLLRGGQKRKAGSELVACSIDESVGHDPPAVLKNQSVAVSACDVLVNDVNFSIPDQVVEVSFVVKNSSLAPVPHQALLGHQFLSFVLSKNAALFHRTLGYICKIIARKPASSPCVVKKVTYATEAIAIAPRASSEPRQHTSHQETLKPDTEGTKLGIRFGQP